MNVTRNGLAAAGILAALALAGCGKPAASNASSPVAAPTQQAAAAAPRACDLLTEAVAKKYLGDGAQLKRNVQTNAKVTQCQWADDHGAITVMSGPWDMVSVKTPADKPVAGLGDEAYDGAGGLYVRKGDNGVSIEAIVASGEFWGTAADDVEKQTIEAEHKVAPDIVAKL